MYMHVYHTYGHLQADFLSLCPERSKEYIQHKFMCMNIKHNSNNDYYFRSHKFTHEDIKESVLAY